MTAAIIFLTNSFPYRNLSAIQDREICCYSISCKEKDNIGKKWLLILEEMSIMGKDSMFFPVL